MEDASSPTRVTRQVAFADKCINESSGLAASRRFPGFIWTHNDSGDSARVFLLDKNGVTHKVVNLEGTKAIDWEDIALAGTKNNSHVYIGDMGDNNRERKEIQIYRFQESQVTSLESKGNSGEQEVRAEKMTLRYPDGAHDAETLIVTARGEIVIVEKAIGVSRIYKTARPFVNNTTQTLVRIGRFHFWGDSIYSRLATGGDVNTREDRVLVRTYSHAYEWKLTSKNGVTDWRGVWNTKAHRFTLPPTHQGEAICYDENSWIVSSEGVSAPLHWLSSH